MEPRNIKCSVCDIVGKEMGADFILKRKDNNEEVIISVDESRNRIVNRISEQYDGNDSRDGIYLSRGMINIDISTTDDEWYITQGDHNYYTFDKTDVLKFIQ